MRKPISKTATMRVPVEVTLQRGAEPDAKWSAEFAGHSHSPLRLYGGDSEAAAKEGFAHLVAEVITRTGQMPVLVIGGNEDYADTMHLIVPDGIAHTVLIVRDGAYAGLWTNDEPLDGALKRVLDHVGGTPKVLRF